MIDRRFSSVETEICARGGADKTFSYERAKQIYTGLKEAKIALSHTGPALKQ